MSTAGSLAYLRQYGFETFSGLIDESYDQITNPRQRLQAVIAEMSRISSLPAAAKTQLFLNNCTTSLNEIGSIFSTNCLIKCKQNMSTTCKSCHDNHASALYRPLQT
jgi:hypothetical protein